jgi:carboxyl-terminal processing protease
MNRFKDSMKNELVGIGVQLQTEGDGAVRISGIVKGGPADRSGVLKLSDRIVAVDAHNTGRSEDMVDIIAMDLDKVVDLIQGDVGTAVALKIEPAQTLHGVAQVTIVARDKVKQKDSQARAQVIIIDAVEKSDKRVGVITLPTFYADFDDGKIGCSADVEKLLIRLMREEIDGLAVDLRGNPGGSLEEVRKIASFFIGNCPVVQVKNTLGQVQVKDSGDTKPIYFGPMIIITDEGSASASEILAGALQDCNRAVIVGNSSTFGKGTVQEPKDIGSMLPYFAARDRAGSLKLTIQKFYRPSGSSTQIEGVIPHISFPNIPDENVVAEKYLDHALPYDRIRPAAKFSPLNIQSLFIPDLQRLSQSRLESNKDFSYAAEDLVKNKSKSSSDHLSLNKAIRERELEESYQLEKDRNLERKIRFIKIAEEDRKVFKFFKISLDDVDNPIELKECLTNNEGGEYMRLEANNAKDLDKPLAFPSGLDPVKRESIQILCDLIDLTERERIAGVLNGKIDSN